MTRLVLIGGGGFAKEVDELALMCGHEVVGYVGDAPGVLDRPYWGGIETLAIRKTQFDSVCIAFGSVDRKSAARRAEMIAWVEQQGFPSVALISKHANLARGVLVADGAVVAHGATLSVDATIGPFAIINSNAIVGHDAAIGRNAVIAPGAFVGGNATIGDNSLIAPGALVLEGRAVGRDVIVGLGATVVRSVADGATVLPVRSRVLK
jgi:acetyltransferase EpsM